MFLRGTLPRKNVLTLYVFRMRAVQLCTRAQILDEWYGVIHQEKEQCNQRIRTSNSTAGSADAQILQLLEAISTEQVQIAAFMQECVCELVLRDLEQLMERYMRKLRKSFSRMYWDEDQPDA